MVHGAAGSCPYGAQHNLWSPAAAGRSFDLDADLAGAARAAARLHDDRQQHRRADGGSVHDAGDRRRSLPRQLGVPHPGASQADDGIGPLRRHLVRPDLRAAVRAGHGDSVDAAVHRERRSLRRLRIQLLVRLHRRDQLGVAERAAADAARPAGGRSTRCSARAPRLKTARRRRREDRSVLDTIVASIDRMKRQLGAADRARLNDYLDDVREIERRIQNVEAHQPQRRGPRAAERAGRACPIRTRSTSS